MSKYLWLVLAGLLLIPFGQDASARGMSYSYHRWYQNPAENVARSQYYDYLLTVDAGFRAYRMRRECGSIRDPALHADCIGTFNQYEPIAAGYGYHHWRHWHRWHRYY